MMLAKTRKVCPRCTREDLMGLLVGDVPAARAWWLKGHLGRCAACAAEWAELQSLATDAAGLREEEPAPGLRDRMLAVPDSI